MRLEMRGGADSSHGPRGGASVKELATGQSPKLPKSGLKIYFLVLKGSDLGFSENNNNFLPFSLLANMNTSICNQKNIV